MDQRRTVTALTWGVIASFFLSSTFIINSIISGSGGHWAWTASLRSLFQIPLLIIIVFLAGGLRSVWSSLKQYPWMFVKWGTIGFGVLYTLMAVSSLFSPGWMIAATFQINILAGMLLSPIIYKDHRKIVPRRPLLLSFVIIAGVCVMQFEKLGELHSLANTLISFVLVVIGAIVWPLGNRKLMVELEEKGVQMNSLQRVLGMSIGCLPLLLVLCMVAYSQSGWPPASQSQASFLAAIFAGFLGGVSFYQATLLASKSPAVLATVEATQVFEILFTLFAEMILRGVPFPGIYGQIGMAIVFTGMILHFRNAFRSRSEPLVVPG